MLTIVNKEGSSVLLMKGAAEILLSKCSTIMTSDGNEIELTEAMKDQLTEKIESLANQVFIKNFDLVYIFRVNECLL